MSEQAFVAVLDGVVEHSPWVAREVYRSHLGDALEAAIRGASRERQLELVRAHPELSSGEALTAESASEQARAGLDRGGLEQRALNAAYRKRFGFPLVVCVREHTPDSILAWGRERLSNPVEVELDVAVGEIAKIARYRLRGAAVISTHVLDTSRGRPAAGVPVRLEGEGVVRRRRHRRRRPRGLVRDRRGRRLPARVRHGRVF